MTKGNGPEAAGKMIADMVRHAVATELKPIVEGLRTLSEGVGALGAIYRQNRRDNNAREAMRIQLEQALRREREGGEALSGESYAVMAYASYQLANEMEKHATVAEIQQIEAYRQRAEALTKALKDRPDLARDPVAASAVLYGEDGRKEA